MSNEYKIFALLFNLYYYIKSISFFDFKVYIDFGLLYRCILFHRDK